MDDSTNSTDWPVFYRIEKAGFNFVEQQKKKKSRKGRSQQSDQMGRHYRRKSC